MGSENMMIPATVTTSANLRHFFAASIFSVIITADQYYYLKILGRLSTNTSYS